MPGWHQARPQLRERQRAVASALQSLARWVLRVPPLLALWVPEWLVQLGEPQRVPPQPMQQVQQGWQV